MTFRSFHTSTFLPIKKYPINIVINLVWNNRMKGFEIVSVDGIVVGWGVGTPVLQVHRLLAPRVLPRGLRLLPGRKALQVFLGKGEYKLSSLLCPGFVWISKKTYRKTNNWNMWHTGSKKITDGRTEQMASETIQQKWKIGAWSNHETKFNVVDGYGNEASKVGRF